MKNKGQTSVKTKQLEKNVGKIIQALLPTKNVTLRPIEFFAVFAAASLFAVTSFRIVLHIFAVQSYPEFIVGSATWVDQTKVQDLVSPVAFIVSFLFFGFVVSKIFARVKILSGDDEAGALAIIILVFSLAPLLALINYSAGVEIANRLQVALVAPLAVTVFLVGWSAVHQQVVSSEKIGYTILSGLLLGLLPLEAALVFGRSFEQLTGYVDSEVLVSYFPVSIVVGVVGTGVLSLFTQRKKGDGLVSQALFVSQIGLSAFYLSFFPARLIAPGGIDVSYETGGLLGVLTSSLILASILDISFRYYRFRKSASLSLKSVLSPFAIAAILVFWHAGTTVFPFVTPDDYHFGEQLVGTLVYGAGGVPYIDYFPPHGFFRDDLPLLLSQLFHDGSASGLTDANRIWTGLLFVSAFFALWKLTNNLTFSFVATLVFGSWPIYLLFFVPFLSLWLHPRLLAEPSKWLIVWLLSVPVIILAVPALGLIFVVASGLLVLGSCWSLWGGRSPNELWSEKARELIVLGLAFLGIAFVAFVSPLGQMLYSAIEYVLMNGPINQVAYGVAWGLSWAPDRGFGLGFEVVRNAWIGVCIFLCLVAYTKYSRGTDVLPALFVVAFCLIVIPYSMGRIDPGAFSRMGGVTMLVGLMFAPMAIWHLISEQQKILVTMSVMVLGVSLLPNHIMLMKIWGNAASEIHVPQQTDTASVGLVGIGSAWVAPEHLDRLVRLKGVLDSELDDGESYLDLTGRNAQYYYTNRIPIIRSPAPYNIASIGEQREVVSRLVTNPPRLALLSGDNLNHDGGGVGLRNPLIYRFVLENYVPFRRSGFIFGYHKDFAGGSAKSFAELSGTIANFTDENWDQGFSKFTAAVIVGRDSSLIDATPGSVLVFENGMRRIVMRADTAGGSLWLDGPTISSSEFENARSLYLDEETMDWGGYTARLFQHSFSTLNLQRIPVSWGRSEGSLMRRLKLVAEIGDLPTMLIDLERGDDYRIIGNDPQLYFDLSSEQISGADAGMLRFDFSCEGKSAEPQIQIFWWGDELGGPSEHSSLLFTADEGILLIPLDSYPLWTMLDSVKGIRIDLHNAVACESIDVTELALFQRSIFEE